MKFCVLAVDYDGTIAKDGVLDPDVRSAITEARGRGIVCVLVTGRMLSDLHSLMGDLRLFDCVVAENGAIVTFPATGNSAELGQAPPMALLRELSRRGIAFTRGQCVVEADAGQGCPILSVVRELELPLTLLFNRGRLMVLPQAISKATGLRYAMRTMRLSEHNAIAIGDAENDHQLLKTCEIGLAVEWGSPALKAVADGVLPGQGPPAVASYIRRVSQQPRMSPQQSRHRQFLLGMDGKARPLTLAIRGRNILITGDSHTGKSWVAGLLCEQLILHHYSICVIDAEGDYANLEALPGVIVLGGDDPAPPIREIAHTLRYADVSVVLNLSKMRLKDKRDYVRSVLSLLMNIRRATGIPHRIVIDEAHYFLHDADSAALLDSELAGYILVTYQASSVHPAVLAATEGIIVTRESNPREVRALRSIQGGDTDQAEWESVLRNLSMDEAVLLPSLEEARGALCKFRVAPRLTQHVRHRNKYLDTPLLDAHAFVFVRDGALTGQRARTMRDFIAILASASRDLLDGHLRRNDFSRWIADVFRDNPLADRIREIENRYVAGSAVDTKGEIIQAVEERYKPRDEVLAANP
ncbi:MAG TPA: HAD hydrolase family protein [Blastocatellia bacterium]|nr:HAD hydrolase family protein [Blastocatellia bacterium]